MPTGPASGRPDDRLRIELRCAIAHRRISRFRVWCYAPSRKDSMDFFVASLLAMTALGSRVSKPELCMDLIAVHISHRFGALEVLDDVSFTVGSGEVVAVVGPSGCGKSTLLSILGGLLQPSAGAAELRGAPPPDSRNPLTFVFQDFALLPWCTVEANVEFPLLHGGLAATARRATADDALGRTSLSDF